MKSRRTASLAASVLALWVSASQAHANSITADFTVKNGVAGVPSGGEVTFALNPDGTIAASLTFSVDIETFGFDSPIELGSIPDLLPPLWEHPDDIPALGEHFAARYAKRCNRVVKGISPASRKAGVM